MSSRSREGSPTLQEPSRGVLAPGVGGADVAAGLAEVRRLALRQLTAAAGDLTYQVLLAYAVALPAFVATEVITRGLIALRDEPREDAVFKRLAHYCPDRELPLARLRQEHRIIEHSGENLRVLLQEAASDAMVSRAEIEVAAASYLVYYGNHIAHEEEDVMPLARKMLGEADWQAARDVVPSGSDPMLGPNPQERYRMLRRRIALEAGAPA